MFCEFISQSYSFPLRKPFAKTVLVEFSKWYLETDRWLWWKRIFFQLKTENRLSEKLVCDMWLPLTELQLCFVELFSSLITVESETCYFGSLWRQRDKGTKEIPKINTGKKLSEKLLCDTWLPLTELLLYFLERFASLISVESENCYFASHLRR